MNIMSGSSGGIAPPIDSERLMIVSVILNNICNLRCRHCYLDREPSSLGLKPSEWELFFDSLFHDLRPDLVAFAGKEIFADRASVEVMFRAIEQRDMAQLGSDRTRIGVITNGTLLHHYRRGLLDAMPDWIDVSVDGLPALHDAIRGNGAFEHLDPNLRWLTATMPERLWITHTMMDHNTDQLDAFVGFFNRNFGIEHFSIGVYRPLEYTDHRLTLPPQGRDKRIVHAIKALAEVQLTSPVRVQVECDFGDSLQSLLAMQGMELEGWPLAQGTNRFDNGLTLVLRAMRVPVGLWRAVRVSAEGLWLAAEDLLDARRYEHNAVGSLRACHFDALELHRNGLEHPRFRQLTGMSADAFLEGVRQVA